jgi:ferrous iron transport protein B
MATRTLEDPRERRLTILMNPFMSCGARLPVYVLFAAAFFPNQGQNLVFGLYLIGILVAVLTGLIMTRTLLAGSSSGFVMELPPYHLPTGRGVALRTWDRLKLFLTEAGRVIVIMVLALNLLNSVGSDGSFGNQDSEHSLLSGMGRLVVPVFAPLGIEEDNWPAAVGIFTGVLAKEAVVGSLDALYSRMAQEQATTTGAEPEKFDLAAALVEAVATVPNNLAGVADLLLDPLGLGSAGIESGVAVASAQGVDPGVFGAMAARFDGAVGAFAYLLFILLYFPCVATIGAIVRETSLAWAGFVACWTTGVAFAASTGFYQAVTFDRHPVSSSIWLAGMLLALGAVLVGLRYWGRRGAPTEVPA